MAWINSVVITRYAGIQERFLTDTNFSAARPGVVRLLNADLVDPGGVHVLGRNDGREIRRLVHRDTLTGVRAVWPLPANVVFAGPDNLIHVLWLAAGSGYSVAARRTASAVASSATCMRRKNRDRARPNSPAIASRRSAP